MVKKKFSKFCNYKVDYVTIEAQVSEVSGIITDYKSSSCDNSTYCDAVHCKFKDPVSGDIDYTNQ